MDEPTQASIVVPQGESDVVPHVSMPTDQEEFHKRSRSPEKRDVLSPKSTSSAVSPARSLSRDHEEAIDSGEPTEVEPNLPQSTSIAPTGTQEDVSALLESHFSRRPIQKRSPFSSPRQMSPTRGQVGGNTNVETQFRPGGITIGAGKAVGAVVDRDANGQGVIVENRESERGSRGKKKAA